MGKFLAGCGSPTAIAPVCYSYPGGTGGDNAVAISAETNSPVVRTAFTVSSLGVIVDATGTGRSLRIRKNSGNGNVVVSPTDSTAGPYYDTSHSDSFANSDTLSVQYNGSGGSYVNFVLGWVGDSGSANTVPYCFAGDAVQLPNTLIYRLNSYSAISTIGTAADQSRIRAQGTVKNLVVSVFTNAHGGNTPFTFSLNGSHTLLAATVTASTSGQFEDTSHTITLASGDLVNMEVVVDGSGGILNFWGSTVVFTGNGSTNDIAGVSTATYNFSASNQFSHIFTGSFSTTEANWAFKHNFAVTASSLRMYADTSTLGSAVAVNLRKNGADATQVLSITTGASGWFEDTTHTDAFTATDTFNLRYSGGTSGSVVFHARLLTETPPSPTLLPPPPRKTVIQM